MSRYLVGFDRFIALDWANYAFEISSQSDSEMAKKAQLRDWLSLRVSGKDAARKTANVLSRLWLDDNPDARYFRNEALKIRFDTTNADLLIFHWGMSLIIFPFFGELCTQAGRLFTLQSKITRRDIQIRMAEKFSNQGTVPRSVDRVLQSLVNWGLLYKLSLQEYKPTVHMSTNSLLKKWLLEVVVFSAPNKRISVQEVHRVPVLFPFNYIGEAGQIASTSSRIAVERDGNNIDYFSWIDE